MPHGSMKFALQDRELQDRTRHEVLEEEVEETALRATERIIQAQRALREAGFIAESAARAFRADARHLDNIVKEREDLGVPTMSQRAKNFAMNHARDDAAPAEPRVEEVVEPGARGSKNEKHNAFFYVQRDLLAKLA